jgi:hypothetical protein
MYLHLLYDKKFAKGQIELFEKHYPDQSLYLITRGCNTSDLDDHNVMLWGGLSKQTLNAIVDRCSGKIEYVFVYNATDIHSFIALYMKRRFQCKVYWMFFGSDLYDNLYYRFNYPLLDNEHKSIKKYLIDKLKLVKHWPLFKSFAAIVDYFCFWNIYDYELLKKYVKTHAEFKFYVHGKGLLLEHEFADFKTKDLGTLVQINHSASWDGNHVTVLKRLAEIDSERKLNLLIPLSYGSKSIVEKVSTFVDTVGLKAQLLTDFMPKDEYFQMIGKVNSVIFGQHRQEGGGNILHALKSGTKVFLREDNNLLQLYRDWGLKVFSFEKDLNSVDELITPLSKDYQELNYHKIHEALSREKVDESMRHFLEE